MSIGRSLSDLVSTAFARAGARLLRSHRLMRAPIWLYRARLGFLFGSRMLMLEHTGRKSGARRHVVLEVFGHPTPDTYVVVSGFGGRAQWFRNVRADPHVLVSVAGRTAAPATARLLTPEEAASAMSTYVAQHPKAWRTFKPVLEATFGAPIDDRSGELPMVGLQFDRGLPA